MASQTVIECACAVLIDAQACFLLQQRDNVPGIALPGRGGFFGGHREDGESNLQCVVREIKEEISYFPADRLVVTEGSLLIMPKPELATIEHKLSPTSSYGLASWLGNKKSCDQAEPR